MKFGLEPIAHVPPLRRVDLGARKSQPADVDQAGFAFSPSECDRIWKLTRQVAEGTNVAEREVAE